MGIWINNTFLDEHGVTVYSEDGKRLMSFNKDGCDILANGGEEDLSNKKLGNDFERVFCEKLAENGFWVHNMAQKRDGQPADVIAVFRNIPHLIDCKVCSNGTFDLSRVEENQRSAMELWVCCGNFYSWFAILLPNDEIWMIPFKSILAFISTKRKSIDTVNIRKYGISFEEWCCYANRDIQYYRNL